MDYYIIEVQRDNQWVPVSDDLWWEDKSEAVDESRNIKEPTRVVPRSSHRFLCIDDYRRLKVDMEIPASPWVEPLRTAAIDDAANFVETFGESTDFGNHMEWIKGAFSVRLDALLGENQYAYGSEAWCVYLSAIETESKRLTRE